MNRREVKTQEIIEGFKGLPGEWYMLKGLLCAPNCTKSNLEKEYDTMLIARRMDEINGARVQS